MNTEVMFSSKTDQWSTPQDFFDKLNQEFCFSLDPCADETNHKCKKYFTEQDNGLLQDWTNETVFCNPPYGREIHHWVKNAFPKCIPAVALVRLCSFLHELTHNGFTSTYTKRQKSALSKGV